MTYRCIFEVYQFILHLFVLQEKDPGVKYPIEMATAAEDWKDEKETKQENPKTSELTEWELEVATKVFRTFETGLREGTILPKVRLFCF